MLLFSYIGRSAYVHRRCIPAQGYEDFIEGLLGENVPKMVILLLLLLLSSQHKAPSEAQMKRLKTHLRLWNREMPVSPKYDGVDLFSGCGAVSAGQDNATGWLCVGSLIFEWPSAAVRCAIYHGGLRLVLYAILCLDPMGPRPLACMLRVARCMLTRMSPRFCMASPVCSSWVWVNRASSARSDSSAC